MSYYKVLIYSYLAFFCSELTKKQPHSVPNTRANRCKNSVRVDVFGAGLVNMPEKQRFWAVEILNNEKMNY